MFVARRVGSRLHKHFGTQSQNVRISNKDQFGEERVDRHLHRYGHLFRSFIMKRRILRSEIWPKIHIIEEVPAERHHLSTQKLFSMKKSMKDEMMMTIAKNDPSQINSSFIISIFSEDYFKELMDEYLSKVLVCGKAPIDEEAQQNVEEQVKQLYMTYYYGEKNTQLERQIEQSYLSAKQYKFIRFQSLTKSKDKKAEIMTCTWTEKDQKMIEETKNWPVVNTNLTDANYRSYFEPLQYKDRLPARLKFEQLHTSWTWLDQLQFKWSTQKYYIPVTSQYFDWIAEKLFLRIMKHIKSIEYSSSLNVPHDYMIEAQMIQIHFWLIINRLKNIGTMASTTLAKRISFSLNAQILKSAQSVNLKKSNLLIASLQRMLQMNSSVLEMHFNRSELTRNNPYKSIDALVWSIAFAQKVHRYSDQVYLFSQYLVKNFQHLQRHSQEDLLNGIIEFDAFLIDPDYRAKIEKINPPLSAAEFEKQFNSDSSRKEYYYLHTQKQMQAQLDTDIAYMQKQKPSPDSVDIRFSFSELLQPIRNLRVKYFSLKTMDHFNNMEEDKKKNEEIEKKGTWKSPKDQVKQIEKEFSKIQALKNQRKKLNENSKSRID